jgi:ABC-2 type transport system ATP-binding protein
MIVGLIAPSEGEIFFGGQPVARDPVAHRRRLGYVPEDAQIYGHLTGGEYLEMVGQLRGIPEKTLARKIDGFLRLFSLHGDRYVQISSYSKGMRQKVLIASALLHNPDLILLDEPFSGLDVNSALVLRDLIRELAARGRTVLFSSHELDVVERVSSRVVILHKGRVVANNPIAELRALMSLPTLEEIFRRLAVEQDTGAITSELAALIES